MLINPSGNGKDNVNSQSCMSELKINNAQATPDLNANSNAFIGGKRRYISWWCERWS